MTTSTSTSSTFNAIVFRILNGIVSKLHYIEFIELCIFYQKMNEHNTDVLKRLSDAVCRDYGTSEEVNETLNGLARDREDEGLYRFMISFSNL